MTAAFLTGGSGVVGGAVARHLLAAGHEVRALSRSERSDRVLVDLGAIPVRGDILGPLEEQMAGTDVVFHAAGVNAMCARDPGPMVEANVAGSRNVVAAARTAGVRRVVYTSSAVTIGEQRGTVASETSPHRGWYLSEYERSKHLAEQVVMAERGIEVVSVNPSSVQGPGRATGTGAIVLRLLRGDLPMLVDTPLSIVDIDDCARGHLLAAERGVAGERYLLNSFTIGMREATALVEEVLGHALPVRYVPGRVAALGAAAVEAVWRLTGRNPPVCREMMRTVLHGHRYDGSKAAGVLGLDYAGPAALIRRLVDWFRAEGMIGGAGG